MKLAGAAVWTAIGGLLVLRNDLWQFGEVRPVLWGVLPLGLWWHMVLCVLSAGCFLLAGRYCWPSDLEAFSRVADLSEASVEQEHRP